MVNKPVFETEYVRMWFERGVIHTAYPPKLVVTLDIAKKIVDDRLAYTEGRTYPGLADARNMLKADYAAMKYWATADSYKCLSALAVFSNNRLIKTFFNFWFKVDRPYNPTKYFNDMQEAYLFLARFVHLN